MLSALLLNAVVSNEVRVLNVTGILDTQGTATISRKIDTSGELTFTIHDQWGKNDSWTETLVQSIESELIKHSFSWKKPSGKDSLWSTSIVDGQAHWRTEKYEGEDLDGGIQKTKLGASEVGDPSLTWWSGTTPELGLKTERNRFVPMFGYEKETITFVENQTLSFGSTRVSTHKLQRSSPKLTIVVWLDDEGMPVRREFYQTGSANVHRVDVWITK